MRHRVLAPLPAVVMGYRAKRPAGGAAPATVNKNLREVRSALRDARDAGLRRKGPVLHQPESRCGSPEEPEFDKWLGVCENPSQQAAMDRMAGVKTA